MKIVLMRTAMLLRSISTMAGYASAPNETTAAMQLQVKSTDTLVLDIVTKIPWI